MIFHPKVGQAVEVRYRASVREGMPLHGRRGHITRVGRGPGPINCEVAWMDGDFGFAVVPRGNLFAIEVSRHA